MQNINLKEIVTEACKGIRRKTSCVLERLAFNEIGIRHVCVPLDSQQINNGPGAGQPVNLTRPSKTKARTGHSMEP